MEERVNAPWAQAFHSQIAFSAPSGELGGGLSQSQFVVNIFQNIICLGTVHKKEDDE